MHCFFETNDRVRRMMIFAVLLSLSVWIISTHSFSVQFGVRTRISSFHRRKAAIQRDELGYEIKPKDWFNGLSLDPGASLTDPRAVPPECREFVEKVKSGSIAPALQETIDLIDKHYNYFEVPFTCGDILNKPNENTGSAKIFSFGLMTRLSVPQTLSLFGEVYRNLTPNGSDHPNIRNFQKFGWAGVTFSTGLAIISKLQAYDDTDTALATQALLEGKAEWDTDSDSWIP